MATKDHVFTLGVEEEFQIVDPETRELRSHIQQFLADGRMILQERVKPKLHQSIVELDTDICSDARDALLHGGAVDSFVRPYHPNLRFLAFRAVFAGFR